MKNYNTKNLFFVVVFFLLLFTLIICFLYKNSKSQTSSSESKKNVNTEYNDKRGKNYIIINDFVYAFYKDHLISISNDITQGDFKYIFYENNNFLTKGTIKKVKSWNIFDESGNFVSYNGSLFGFTDNLNISLIDYYEDDLNTDDYAHFNKRYSVFNEDDITFSKKYITDLNNNGVQDYVYVLVSEKNPQDGIVKKNRYHIITASIDGKFYEINYVKREENKTYPNFSLNTIFVEDDKIYLSFDAKYNPWDIDNDYNLIYLFNKNSFTNAIN